MGSEPQWPEAVVFDLDGTLADTVLNLAAALNQTLAELDLPPHPPEVVRTMVGADWPSCWIGASPPTVRRSIAKP